MLNITDSTDTINIYITDEQAGIKVQIKTANIPQMLIKISTDTLAVEKNTNITNTSLETETKTDHTTDPETTHIIDLDLDHSHTTSIGTDLKDTGIRIGQHLDLALIIIQIDQGIIDILALGAIHQPILEILANTDTIDLEAIIEA